jgi:predicted permease
VSRWRHAVIRTAALAVPARYRDEVLADLVDQHHRLAPLLVAILRSGRDARRQRQERSMERVSLWSGLGADVRSAWRQHRAHATGALAIVGILAFAIGLNTALFSMVQAVLIRPLGLGDESRVVFIWNLDPQRARFPMTPARALDLRREITGLESAALIGHLSMTVTGRGPAERWSGASVSSSFFDVLQAPAAVGRTFRTNESNRDVVVLSHRLWVEQFDADASVIGTTVVLNGRARVIAGIMPASFYWPATTATTSAANPPLFWACAPASDVPERPVPFEGDPTQDRQTGFIRVVARIQAERSLAAVQAEADAVAARLAARHPQTDGGQQIELVAARAQMLGPVEQPMLFVVLASALVVLGACVNVGNLLLVRQAGRRRELAVRSALGASRWRVTRQLMMEALVLAAAGGVLGVAVAAGSMRWLIALAPDNVGRLDLATIDARVLGMALIATTLSGLALGGLSAFGLMRDRSADDLRGAGVAEPSRSGLRRALVAAEVAIAVTLLVGASLFGASLLRLQRVDVGFDTRNLLTFDVTLGGTRAGDAAAQTTFLRDALEQIRAVPGVRAASAAVTLPIGGDDFGTGVFPDGRPLPAPGTSRRNGLQIVGEGWFSTLGQPLVAGRDFSAGDITTSSPVILVNQRLAELEWPGESPIGKRARLDRDADAPVFTVIGVVGDIHHTGPSQPARPEVYLAYNQMPFSILAFAVRTDGDPGALAPAVRRALGTVDPSQPSFNTNTMDAHLGRAYGRARFLAALTIVFGGLALGLAVVGVYGVTSFAVAQRTREFGVRTALGASPLQLMRTVVGENLTPVGAGIGAGLAVAATAAQAIQSLLFDTTSLDATAYVAAAALLVVTALCASVIPARRAARIDPVRALRNN